MIIYDIKDDPVLQVSGQEPAKSSKFPPSWPLILDKLLIKMTTKNFKNIFPGEKSFQNAAISITSKFG